MSININSGFRDITIFSVSANSFSGHEIDWGDGTYSDSSEWPFTHTYTEAGDYTVNIIGCSSLSSVAITEEVCVSNYLKPTISITNNTSTSNVGEGGDFTLSVSAIDPNITLNFYASGSDSVPYNSPEGFWDHLNPRWRFLDEDDNVIKSVTLTANAVSASDVIVGYVNTFNFTYIDDMPGDVVLFVTLDLPNYNSRVYSAVPHTVNTLPPNELLITEDGLNEIYEIQWAGKKIPYVVSFSNSATDSTILHYTSANILSANLTSQCTWLRQSIATYNIDLTDENCFNTGGYLLTSITVPETDIPAVSTMPIIDECDRTDIYQFEELRYPAQNATIYVEAEVTYDGGAVTTLSGQSNSFTIYPFEAYNNFRRRGESKNLSEDLKYYSFTDRMRNFEELWNYMESLFGTNIDTLGSRAYFGIDRFADQHSDLDRCNINSIIDMSNKFDVIVDDYGLEMPSDVKRIVDVASLPMQKLVGGRCNCSYNFSEEACPICGNTNSSTLGSVLTNTDYITAGTEILYREEGSDVIDVHHVLPQDNENVYTLGTLSAEKITSKGIGNFCFYNVATPSERNSIFAEIDYDSYLTTINPQLSSEEDWYRDGGIIEEALLFTLLRGLELD